MRGTTGLVPQKKLISPESLIPKVSDAPSQGSGIDPGHKLINAARGPAVNEFGQHIGEPSVRIDAIEFARLCRARNYAEQTDFPQHSQ